ncbi:MAG: hypothetical protein V7603_2809 [Micromonosporaceae bacterium]
MNSALRRLWPLVAVGALLGAAAIAVALSTPQVKRVPFELARPGVNPTPSTEDSPFNAIGAPPASPSASKPIELGWLNGVLEVVCGIAVALVAAVLIFLLVRNSLETRKGRLPVEPEQTRQLTRREEVLAAVDAGLSDLDDDDRDPRRAVIACWVRLEQAAAAAGTPREPGDSPTDLVARLLAAHQVSAQVLYPLADVYRLARYATHTVDSGMRDQARAALRQLRAELTVSRSGPLEQVP